MLYTRGQSGLAASSVTGTVDQQMLSSLGLNPLGITDDELDAVEMRSEEAKLINAALNHVTLSVLIGLLQTQIYISKMCLFSHKFSIFIIRVFYPFFSPSIKCIAHPILA